MTLALLERPGCGLNPLRQIGRRLPARTATRSTTPSDLIRPTQLAAVIEIVDLLHYVDQPQRQPAQITPRIAHVDFLGQPVTQPLERAQPVVGLHADQRHPEPIGVPYLA